MSYSRWSDSIWYTYWGSNKDHVGKPHRNSEVFEICPYISFTYLDLKNNIEGCIDKTVEAATKPNTEFGIDKLNIGDSERNELRYYMERFISDVEDEYPDVRGHKK